MGGHAQAYGARLDNDSILLGGYMGVLVHVYVLDTKANINPNNIILSAVRLSAKDRGCVYLSLPSTASFEDIKWMPLVDVLQEACPNCPPLYSCHAEPLRALVCGLSLSFEALVGWR